MSVVVFDSFLRDLRHMEARAAYAELLHGRPRPPPIRTHPATGDRGGGAAADTTPNTDSAIWRLMKHSWTLSPAPTDRRKKMTATQVDPRVIAHALLMGTDDLARVLTKWAQESLPSLEYDREWSPTSLEDFEDAVERARCYLVAAHEAQKAWDEDNPETPEGAEEGDIEKLERSGGVC